MSSDQQSREKARPLSITVIALWQFLRASVLFFIVSMGVLFPAASFDKMTSIKVLGYLASRQSLPSMTSIPIVTLLIGIYLFATGLGVWFLKKWARNLLMVTSGMEACLWIRGFIYYGAIGGRMFENELQRQTVAFVILLDLVVCIYLYQQGGAFGEPV